MSASRSKIAPTTRRCTNCISSSAWELSGTLPRRTADATQRARRGAPAGSDFLYREAILLEWIETGEDLYRLVRNVVVHEIAHHFGFSDEDIAAIEQEPDGG